MRFSEGEFQVCRIVNGKSTCTQIEGIVSEIERFVEIQKLKVDVRAAFLVLGARLVEQFIRKIPAGNGGLSIGIVVE